MLTNPCLTLANQFAGSHPADAGRKCFPLDSSGHAALLDSDYIKGPSSLLVFSILLYFSVRGCVVMFASPSVASETVMVWAFESDSCRTESNKHCYQVLD